MSHLGACKGLCSRSGVGWGEGKGDCCIGELVKHLCYDQRNGILENIRQEVPSKKWSQGNCVQTALNIPVLLSLSLAVDNLASTLRLF